ncbi:alpha-mannosidase [Halobacillus salinarum]|uniref:Alpha-mannosidase n=1 Tax=Halobacillus salinarum TaxID=2932257 RepID=A0ABY4EMH1_9BACI|nr:alpha-mannosidase [Halobacillus salinarum]UOQ45585.1 alpha-mannosidase [Halobacillus salinarum]
MFWTIEKLEQRISELNAYRYIAKRPLESFASLPDEEGEVAARPPEAGDWGTWKTGERWEGRDQYVWLKKEISFPGEWENEKIVGVFDFGITDGGHNSGFESLLYVNGEPYQGVDMNHQEVIFDRSLAGSRVELCFRLWSGLEGGGAPTIQEHKLKQAFIACLDEKTDDLYFTSAAALETVNYLDENQPERLALLKALDRAFYVIDWSEPGSEHFYKSVHQAQEQLRSGLEKIPNESQVRINAIGHTHIDVAWLWRLKHTREKAARSFSTVLRLMEQYPDYVFLQTQPQLYDYVSRDYPELYDQMKKRIEEGRWEPEGGMWLEADCNLTSGESLVRQLLLGTRFFKEQFGKECEYLWLPDVFGYSWALPQILVKSGIKTFMTTKISWSQYNKMPHDTFKWRGMDGTEILTHFITTPEDDRWFYTYNGKINARSVKGIWDAYRDKELNQELILAYGYGDGGGGVNREMLEMRRRFDEMPGLPEVKTGRADDYFRRLHKTIDETDQYVHTWDGELYLEYHRGTYTSQAYNKRMNRKMELLLREAEWMNAFNSIEQDTWEGYPKEELTESWKTVLRNQFHDIIPGSSIREVYEDSKIEYEEAEGLAASAWNKAAEQLVTQKAGVYTIFNSAPHVRTDLVRIKHETNDVVWKDSQGKVLDAQKTADGDWLVAAEQLPSLGKTVIEKTSGSGSQDSPFTKVDQGIITPFYELRWNEKGQLTALVDLQNDRSVLAEGKKGNVFQVFEDKPMRFDAWDIDIYYQQKQKEIDALQSVEVIESGSIRSVIEFVWNYHHSTIKQNMIVYAKNRRIDFETYVDWHEREQLLKTSFPVDIRSTEATYDIQYGNVKRPTHWNTSWDYARFESVGHQWADLSETGYGVSLLNNCKYGHDIKDNVMRLTLLKSALNPDIEQDQGEHWFTYSLLPHKDGWKEADTVQEAWALNNPLTCREGQSLSSSLFHVNSGHVWIDAVKKAEDEDEIIVRMHEFTGARSNVEVTSDYHITSWQECNLMERPVDSEPSQGAFHFEIKPYEIRTFRVALKQ